MEGDEADTENSFNCDLECPMRMKQITSLHIHMVSTIYSWENSTTSTASCNCAYRSVHGGGGNSELTVVVVVSPNCLPAIQCLVR